MPFSVIDRSEEVQEIIGRAPGWIVRTGTVVVAGVLFAFLLGAWFIKYPDLADAPVTFSSTTPPVQLAANISGRLRTLYVHDGDFIQANQVVGIMENAAVPRDVFYLSKVAGSIDTTLSIDYTLSHIILPTTIQVGDIQADYTILYQAIMSYKFFIKNNNYSTQISNIRTQIQYYNKINNQLLAKRLSLDEQLKLEHQKDSINQILFGNKVIAKLDFDNNHKAYLSQRLLSIDNSTNIIQNKSQQSEYLKNISDIQHTRDQEYQNLISKVREAAKTLVGRIAQWDKQYVLRTPTTGRIAFFKVWTPNQYVKAEEPIFVVTTSLKEQVIRASLPIYKAGKVKVGQPALIKLDEYPFGEFGMLRGTIEKISEVALDKNYIISIRLSSMRTTTGYNIPLRAELSGVAQFVTEDRNIIQRIFSQVYGRLKT